MSLPHSPRRRTAPLLALTTLAGGLLVAAALLVAGPQRVPPPADGAPATPASGGDAAVPAPLADAPLRAEIAAPRPELPELERRDAGDTGKERTLHARLLEEARSMPRQFAADGAAILASDRPDPDKVAVLRAAWDARVEGVGALFAQAAALPDAATARADSVPSFAVRLLGKHAADDEVARAALEEIALAPGSTAARSVRMRATAAFAGAARDAELQRLIAHVFRWDAPDLRQTVVSALLVNHHPGARYALDVLDPGGPRPQPEIER